ncbi:MAG TPA: MMPL family transporter [Solirubrobacterales bacterium]|nr:MMPL family transporter [Solirubrobacterales bacterium]
MTRLAELLARRRWWVAGAWLAVVVVSAPLAARQTEHLSGGGFQVPGSQSKLVEDVLVRDFEPDRQGTIAVVLQAAPDASPAERKAALERLDDALAGISEIELSRRTERAARAELARKDVVVVPLTTTTPASELTDAASDLRDALAPGEERGGVTPYLAGQPAVYAGLQELSKQDLERAEVTGFPIVALILLAVFGSAAAASLPLALGFGSVLVTGGMIYLISQHMEMSVFVTNMASMIGIGVAVDYSLFILARFREEVRGGKTAGEARAAALSTSGLAVVFSGMAVIISLAGLWMIDNQTLRSMSLGAMIVVAVSLLTATLLLPALIRILGYRVEAGGVPWSVITFVRVLFRRRRRPGSTSPERPAFWERWTARVMARPVVSVTVAAAVLLTLAIPVLSMKTGNAAVEQFPSDHDVSVGADLAAEQTGGGANSVEIVARLDSGTLDDPANSAAVSRLAAELRRDPEVAALAPPTASEDGRSVLFEATPRSSSESGAAMRLVERLRERTVPESRLADRAELAVGGETARIDDVRTQIDDSMWKIIAFVLGLSFVVLVLMLRSLLLPLKAILMNLLSIGAAYGVLVIVFQWGWFDGVAGFESLGAIDTLNPPLILAVVFGLSMDYEVFLLSRIRERYEEHGDNRRAVAEGLSSSARTISSAALIMTAVFSVFVLTGVPSIQELGLGNAVAVALDATLVRLVLVPAAMQLMGRWNWWLPGWLDRVLPDLGFERSARPAAPAQAA